MTERLCVLDGAAIASLEQVFDALFRQLDLPEYFGRNLDALWDVLAGDVDGPVTLVWRCSNQSATAMGPDYERLVALLRDVERARADFTLKLE